MEATAKLKAVKKVSFPHTFIIIFALIVVAVLLTWIIPAGMYDLSRDQGTKKSWIRQPSIMCPKRHQSPEDSFVYHEGYEQADRSDDGDPDGRGCLPHRDKSGSLQAILAMGARKFSDRLEIFLPALT